MFIDSVFAWIHSFWIVWYNRVRWIVTQVLSIIIISACLFWVSLFMYTSFYYMYIPSMTHHREVHLQFRTDCDTDDRMCSFPSSNLTLTMRDHQQMLARGQSYVVSLDIELPESQVNQNLGMFMVSLELYTTYGTPVRKSSRSVLLEYKSPLHQTLETYALFPYLLFGTSLQKQKLTARLFDDFQDNPYKPVVGAFIEIESKRVQIYSCKLRIHASFSGLRYIMYYWPVLSTAVGVGSNLVFLLFVTMLSWYRYGSDPPPPQNPPPDPMDMPLTEVPSPSMVSATSGHRRFGSTGGQRGQFISVLTSRSSVTSGSTGSLHSSASSPQFPISPDPSPSPVVNEDSDIVNVGQDFPSIRRRVAPQS